MRALLPLVALLLALLGLTLWKGMSKEPLPAVQPAESTLFLGLETATKADPLPPKKTPVSAAPAAPAIPKMPKPPAKQPSPPNPQPLTYTVKSGDSFYRILQGHYGSADDGLLKAVADANQVKDPSALSIGQTLILPVVPGQKAPARP